MYRKNKLPIERRKEGQLEKRKDRKNNRKKEGQLERRTDRKKDR